MKVAVVDDEIDDLAFGKAGIQTEARQGEIVPALALVLQVVPLATPGVPEPHSRDVAAVGPCFNHVVWNPCVQIDDQRLVREPFGPLARSLLIGFRIGDRGVVQEFFKVRDVVSAVGKRQSSTGFGCAPSLKLVVDGRRNTRARSDSRS